MGSLVERETRWVALPSEPGTLSVLYIVGCQVLRLLQPITVSVLSSKHPQWGEIADADDLRIRVIVFLGSVGDTSLPGGIDAHTGQ